MEFLINQKKNKEFQNFYTESGFKKKTNKYFEINTKKYNYKDSGLFKINYEKN